jgi:hypothetical protein
VAFYPNEGPPLRGYGGIKTVNLTPGDSVNLNINMGELPQLNSMYWISDVQRAENQEAIPFNAVNWSIEATPPISGFYVYRAQGDSQEPPTESFQKIMTIPGISVLFYEDYSIIPDNVYWYKISAYNEYGEGEQSYAIPDQMFIN